jgi:hypothetical protein
MNGTHHLTIDVSERPAAAGCSAVAGPIAIVVGRGGSGRDEKVRKLLQILTNILAGDTPI